MKTSDFVYPYTWPEDCDICGICGGPLNLADFHAYDRELEMPAHAECHNKKLKTKVRNLDKFRDG